MWPSQPCARAQPSPAEGTQVLTQPSCPRHLDLRPGQVSWRHSPSGNPCTRPLTSRALGKTQTVMRYRAHHRTGSHQHVCSNFDSRHCVFQAKSHPARCRGEEEGEETEGRGPCSPHFSTHPLAAGQAAGEEELRRGRTGCVSTLLRAERQPLSSLCSVRREGNLSDVRKQAEKWCEERHPVKPSAAASAPSAPRYSPRHMV